MKTSDLLRSGLLATGIVLGGMTFVTAQSAPDTASATPETRADFRKDHGGHGRGSMMRHMLQQTDANGDGAVTQDEIDTFRAGLVAEADTSGEGDISLAEFETIFLQLARERMVDAFEALDADGDGAVTQAEMDARFGDIVERMDRNDDGQLDRDDRRARDGRKGKRHGHDKG